MTLSVLKPLKSQANQDELVTLILVVIPISEWVFRVVEETEKLAFHPVTVDLFPAERLFI